MEGKRCFDRQNEITIEPEVFQNMDDFELPKEYSCFGMALRLQFPKFSRGFSASDFKGFIEEHVGAENIVALGRLAFPNEWQMELSNKEVREKLIRMERTKISMRTCWISPLSQSEVRGHVHWLPVGIPDEDVVTQLQAYGQVLFVERTTQIKFDLRYQSDMRYFGLFLRSGQTMDDIPHFMFFNSFQAYVSIRGRAPVCFHCRLVGHRKSECKTFFERLGQQCCRAPPGLMQRMRPRGRRFMNHNQIQRRKARDMLLRKMNRNSEDVTEVAQPQVDHIVEDESSAPNEIGIVTTLSNPEVLSGNIEDAARYICTELKKKKKKKKPRRSLGRSLP